MGKPSKRTKKFVQKQLPAAIRQRKVQQKIKRTRQQQEAARGAQP
jgi:hypothetical protein